MLLQKAQRSGLKTPQEDLEFLLQLSCSTSLCSHVTTVHLHTCTGDGTLLVLGRPHNVKSHIKQIAGSKQDFSISESFATNQYTVLCGVHCISYINNLLIILHCHPQLSRGSSTSLKLDTNLTVTIIKICIKFNKYYPLV